MDLQVDLPLSILLFTWLNPLLSGQIFAKMLGHFGSKVAHFSVQVYELAPKAA